MSQIPTYSATIVIKDIDFKAMSGTVGSTPCTEATLTLMPPPQGQPAGIFTGDGDNIVVTVPKTDPGTVVLNFKLPDSAGQYTLLGLAFLPSPEGVGINEFPSISLSRSEGTSLLAVTDDYLKSDDDITFDYLILIQDTTTGDIGAIDPKIRSGIN
jgi:hypothetical protein